MENEYIERFKQSLECWTDERFVSREELFDLAMFSKYLVNLAEDDGWVYDGHSYKNGPGMGCLVVKATLEGVPSVVFTNARTTTACVRIFLRKLDQGILEWCRDKYRG